MYLDSNAFFLYTAEDILPRVHPIQIKDLIMDILFDAQFVNAKLDVSIEQAAFSLTFDPEAMSLLCIGDMAAITVQAQMTRSSRLWNKSQFQNFYPVVLALHGILYGQGNQALGASLVPMENFPLSFYNENSQWLNLSFHCSRSYLQRIEEQRSSKPNSDLTVGVFLWAAMSLVPSAPVTSEDTIPMQSFYQDKLIHIKSRQTENIRISRSHWSDMLSAIEYPQRRYIELPALKPQEGAEELHGAIEHLNQAYTLFAQDRYREAVQRCRQARDLLLGEDKPTWAEKVLAPLILAGKAAMIDESIKALNRMGNTASHGAGIEVDRDTVKLPFFRTPCLDFLWS
jgi:hypothetical protein